MMHASVQHLAKYAFHSNDVFVSVESKHKKSCKGVPRFLHHMYITL